MGDVRQIEHLVIQTAFVGDLLLSIPLLKELRRQFPGDRLVLFCRKGLGDYLIKTGIVDEAVEVDKGRHESWKSAFQKLKYRQFGVLICPHESPRSRLLAMRLHARRKIGYRGFLNPLIFTETVTRPLDLPEAVRQLALLVPIFPEWKQRLFEARSMQEENPHLNDGHLSYVPEWASMEIALFGELRRSFRKSGDSGIRASVKFHELVAKFDLRKEQRIAFLAPGSVWATKMWTHSGYVQAARDLKANGYRVLLMGAPNEIGICRAIQDEVPGVESVAGASTLYESAELLALANILICNDSGAMHLAATVGVPSVAVFGPTVLKFGYRPWQNDAEVIQVDLPCRPCGKHGAQICPIGTHDCMNLVTADQVSAAARRLLQKNQVESSLE